MLLSCVAVASVCSALVFVVACGRCAPFVVGGALCVVVCG